LTTPEQVGKSVWTKWSGGPRIAGENTPAGGVALTRTQPSTSRKIEMQHNDAEQPIKTPASTAKPGRANALSRYFVLLATAGFLVARIPVLMHRPFDSDEFEHAHAAWCVFKGMLPYKDFFEHHTPWYYYTLCPFFHWFEVDNAFESARHFLLFGRGLSLVLTMLSVLLVALIGRLWENRLVGLVAGLFLVGQPFFLQKTIEMRPDVLALPFFLGSLWLLLRGLAPRMDGARRTLLLFLGAGLNLGAAIMCTQKMLFVLPGALAGLGIWSLFAGRVGRRDRILLTLTFLLGICVPATLTWFAFFLRHGGGEFIVNNFLLNATWKHIEAEQLNKLFKTSWPVLALSLVGTSASLYRFFRSGQRQHGGFLLFCPLVGLFAGILVVPVAHRQYYLMPLPIVCLFAAQGLSILIGLIGRAREGARPWLLILAMLPMAVLPVRDLQASLKLRNDRQLEKLRYVFENTKPTDVVMDGWEGTGVFRPHAFYYFFLHEELVHKLPREQVDAYLDALESGRIRPKLIAMDENLDALGPRFRRFVKSNYERREMPGQDRRASADLLKLVKINYANKDRCFYVLKDEVD
jgi:hypothetical protein